MRLLTVASMLAMWDAAATQPTVERSLALLRAACPGQPPDMLAGLSAGQRDRHLLGLREALFGPEVVSLADCPRCGECLELSFQVGDIRAAADEPPETLEVTADGYQVRFRLPNSIDLAALADTPGDDDPAAILLRRCVLSARYRGDECDADRLPSGIVDAITDRMAEADPQADVELSLRCQACDHGWLATFDVASFLWTEIDAWARRLLYEVHVLARTYGWNEAEILALSSRRRQLYLDMAGS